MKTKPYFLFRTALLLIFIYTMHSAESQAYLWGSASQGGLYGFGTIIQGDSDGTNFHTVFSFADTNGNYPIGKMAQANNGLIYVVTALGGNSGSCTICTYEPSSQTLNKIYDFALTPQYGDVAVSGIIKSTNGKLYGVTPTGGLYNNGVLYSVDPASNTYTDLHDIDSTVGPFAFAELLPASDGKLYGLSEPTNNTGNYTGIVYLYSFDPATNNFTIAYTFSLGSSGNIPYPHSPALIQAGDGKIYGLLSNSGSDSVILFNYTISNATVNLLCVLNPSINGTPMCGLVQAHDGLLYGATSGSQGTAMVYSYNINSGHFNVILNLDANTGYDPEGNMGLRGDGKLVFSTTDGGTHNMGALVSVDIASGTYNVMMSMDSTTGYFPVCDILETGESPNGIVQPAPKLIDLYPNPANDVIYLNSDRANTDYTITNMLGETLIKGKTVESILGIDISGLAGGIYFINQVKFVKE